MKGCFLLTLDRGFVLVGSIRPHPELAFHWLVSPCRTVRQWGTTGGLAQLVGGPTGTTVLDPICEETVPWRAVIKLTRVEEEAWLPHLSETRPASAGGSRARR